MKFDRWQATMFMKRNAEGFSRVAQISFRLEMKEMMDISDEILEVHGVAPGRKAEGVTRVS